MRSAIVQDSPSGVAADPEVAVTVFTSQAALENRLSGLRRMRAATGRLLETLGPPGS